MKKLITFALTVIISTTMLTQAFANTQIVNNINVSYTIYGDKESTIPIKFDNTILNVDGTNFFPMRELLNQLGVSDDNIHWNDNERSVTFNNDYYTSKFTIGEETYTQNGYEYPTVEPFIYEDKTYLPIRYVANSLGNTVEYNSNTKEIDLYNVDSYFTDIIHSKDELPQLSELTEDEIIATIDTNYGTITAKLFPEYAPMAVENFITLSQEGYYDGLTFHRVIDDFVIQGGDPNGDGTGGESIYGEPFDNEVSTNLIHINGALSMANAGNYEDGSGTNTSQFFIVTHNSLNKDFEQFLTNAKNEPFEYIAPGFPNIAVYSPAVSEAYLEYGGEPSLDLSYSVFGQVIDGMDIVEGISEVDTDVSNKPIDDVIINSISIKETK